MSTKGIERTPTSAIHRFSITSVAAAAVMVAGIAACSKSDNTSAASDTAAAPPPAAATATTTEPQSGTVRLRGNLTAISDTALTISSDSGDVHVAVEKPLAVYARMPATLSQVTDNSFVGVTSVTQPDGSQRATEIHIFPEKLRGTGEGSYLMQRGNRGGGNPSTMTNGTVSGSAPADSSKAPRMTNGNVSGKPGGTMTVKYAGGTQTITIPPDVNVTAIAPSTTPLAVGSNVSVTATRQPDGTLKASFVMLGGGRGGRRERPQ